MFEIRVANQDEFDKIREFYHRLIDEIGGRNDNIDWQKDVYPSPEMLSYSISSGELFIGEEDGQLAACIIVNCNYEKIADRFSGDKLIPPEKTAMIHAAAVKQRFAYYGFDKQMVKFAIDYAMTQNQKAIWLDGRNNTIHSARLYKILGFKPVETTKVHVDRYNEVYEFYEHLLPPEVFVAPLNKDEISEVQMMVDESFEMNHPYFPQVLTYDDGGTIMELSVHHYFENKSKGVYKLTVEDKIIGCAVISIYNNVEAYVDLFCIAADYQKKNLGYAAWLAIEKYFPQIKIWTLETPICLIKNVCFYVNKCKFTIIKVRDYKNDFRRFVFRKVIE